MVRRIVKIISPRDNPLIIVFYSTTFLTYLLTKTAGHVTVWCVLAVRRSVGSIDKLRSLPTVGLR